MRNNMKQSIIFLFFSCYILNATTVQAENYYLQAVTSSKISAEKQQESKDSIKKHKEVKVQDALEIPPFHKRDTWEKESLSRTFCTNCHLSPPHTKNERARTFLNMHTEFIACETCHMRPKNVAFNYQWMDYRTSQVSPPSVNRFRQVINRENSRNKGEEKDRKVDALIKISPFYNNKIAFILSDHDFSKKSLNIWKKGTLEDKSLHRARIHLPLEKKGPKCHACHQTKKPMLDLKALGANKLQSRSIENHIVPQFFKRYSKDDQKIRINSLLK